MRMFLRALMCVLAVSGILVVTGCGDDDSGSPSGNAADSTTAAEKPTVAPKVAVMLMIHTEYSDAGFRGMDTVLKPIGGSYKEFVSNFDPAKLTQQCLDAISSGKYNSMIISTIEPSIGVPCAKAAHEAGMPVAHIDGAIGTDPNSLEPQVEGVVGGVISSPETNVSTTLELVKKACEGIDPCKTIVEISSASDALTNDVAKAVDALPNAEVVAKFASAYDPAEIAKKLPDVLTANKDANVLVTVADSQALAAQPAITQAGLQGKLIVTGNSGSFEGVQLIKDGKMFGTTGAWPEQNSKIATEMLVKALNKQKIDPPLIIDSTEVDTPNVITKDNVDEFKPEWGKAQ